MKLKYLLLAVLLVVVAVEVYFLTRYLEPIQKVTPERREFWDFRSIDTMKYSRDPAREYLKDKGLEKLADLQVRRVAETGASHVAIATPYDPEFLPVLSTWVKTARKYKLGVWFRGNFSGWEGWFGYEKIGQTQHMKMTKEFILRNPQLFRDGDKFSACPECENGGPGDPRKTGKITDFRKFMIDEYQISKEAFSKIGKRVDSNFASMNGDVANLIMDPETTKKMGGIVVVDHYVKNPKQLSEDAAKLSRKSQGNIIIGEFGAPIPDLNGEMTESEQALWILDALRKIKDTPSIIGVSYWTGFGGSTAIWDNDGVPKKAVNILKSFF